MRKAGRVAERSRTGSRISSPYLRFCIDFSNAVFLSDGHLFNPSHNTLRERDIKPEGSLHSRKLDGTHQLFKESDPVLTFGVFSTRMKVRKRRTGHGWMVCVSSSTESPSVCPTNNPKPDIFLRKSVVKLPNHSRFWDCHEPFLSQKASLTRDQAFSQVNVHFS